jgi:hypothetical protein
MNLRSFCFFPCAALLATGVAPLRAQTAPARPAAPTSATTAGGETVVELSPFVIDATKETGWVATQTLGGSRMKTDFKDLPSRSRC